MQTTKTITSIVIAMGMPSALIAFLFSRFEKRMDKKEKAKEECNILLFQGVRAAISLGEASAIALRDGKTNGETKEALDYARRAKHDINDFLTKQGVENIS